MATIRLAIIALMASLLFLSACGVRGPVEAPPYPAEEEEKQDTDFVLNPLIKS